MPIIVYPIVVHGLARVGTSLGVGSAVAGAAYVSQFLATTVTGFLVEGIPGHEISDRAALVGSAILRGVNRFQVVFTALEQGGFVVYEMIVSAGGEVLSRSFVSDAEMRAAIARFGPDATIIVRPMWARDP